LFNWDDLRYFVAVAREGSMRAAAEMLGVSQSTVQRRLSALEHAIDCVLVERTVNGYTLTAQGRRLLLDAQQMAVAAGDFQRRVNALDDTAAGRVRVASLVTVGQRILKSGFVDRFHDRHPGIQIEMILSQRVVDLAGGEADIAIRGGAPASDALIAKRIANLPWGLFASKDYIGRHGQPAGPDDLCHHSVIALVDELEQLPATCWLRSKALGARVAARCGNIPSAHLAAASGAGIAMLPYIYAAADKNLVCVLGPIPELDYPMYLLVHKDMSRVRRVRTFFDYCARELRPVLLTGNMRTH